MDKTIGKIEELADALKEYVDVKIESAKLMAAEKTSSVVANMAAGLFVIFFLFFFLVFIGIAASLGVGILLGKTWLGFLIIALLYFFLAMICWLARGKLIRIPVMNAIIRQLFHHE